MSGSCSVVWSFLKYIFDVSESVLDAQEEILFNVDGNRMYSLHLLNNLQTSPKKTNEPLNWEVPSYYFGSYVTICYIWESTKRW